MRVAKLITEDETLYAPDRTPVSKNGAPVLLLPLPEKPLTSDSTNPHEQLRFYPYYLRAEQIGSRIVTLFLTMVFHVAEFLTVCASSPMWRTTALTVTHALTSGVTLLLQTVGVIAEHVAALPWSDIWQTGKKFLKLGICVYMDFLDFFIGRFLGFGLLFDVGCACICAALWGKRGWWALWEIVDITEQVDGFLPTCTMIALRSWNDR